MIHNTKKMLLLLMLLVGARAKAQTSLNVTSHSATLEGNIYEYAIGEMTLVSTERASNFIITQGYLQPQASANEPTSSETAVSPKANIKIYPNPTQNIVYVELEETDATPLALTLYDAVGKTISIQHETQNLGNNKMAIDLQAFAAGNYFLFISKPSTQGTPENYSFKIQKIN